MRVKVVNIIDDKTFRALSVRYKKHIKYGKYIAVNKKYLVDSGISKVSIGDELDIVNCRPISKRKNWKIKLGV